jgi:hypothetical protein
MDIDFLKSQAERCRCLAPGTDPFTEKRLLDLARQYDERIAELERGYRPSVASQSLKSG